MADLTDEEFAELLQMLVDGSETQPRIKVLGTKFFPLLEEVERRRRERGLFDSFIAGLCLRTALDYPREWALFEAVLANGRPLCPICGEGAVESITMTPEPGVLAETVHKDGKVCRK